MQIIHAANELNPGSKKVCLAIGVFDGVHLGHQQVIRQMVGDAHQQEAKSIVITFDRHPNTVVAPERVPPQIYSLPHHVYMRVRSELTQLAESAAVAPPVGPRWLDPDAKHLPPSVCVEGWEVLYEVDSEARTVRVKALRKLDASGSSVA